MNTGRIFNIRFIRWKIVLISKLMGSFLIISYIFSANLPFSQELSFTFWIGFVVLLILGFDFLMDLYISKPLEKIERSAKQMADLDFSAHCEINADDEFGRLAVSLNRMAQNLQESFVQLEEANMRLEKTNCRLEVTNVQLEEANIELEETNLELEETNNQLEEANSQLEKTNSQLEEANIKLEETNNQLEEANIKLEKEVRQERLLLAERKELADSLSHEMKTPLGVIRAYAEGLLDEPEEAKKRKYAEIMITETERMSDLITALLDLSALENGAAQLEPEQFDFVELLETVAGRLLMDVPDADFRLEYELPDRKLYVFTDLSRMEQVLNNFVVNAKKNVQPGGILKLCLFEKMGMLRCSVFNQGRCIPAESLQKIWNRFYRGSRSGGGGSGLGLAISAQILSMQNYDYGVKNHADGVEFYFSMPVL